MQSNQPRKQLSFSGYEYSDLCYRFATLYKNNDTIQSDYGTGEVYTSLEVHTVSRIEDNPGITVTEIAEQTGRTKGAVSQIIAKLESKGLVRREKDPNSPRRMCLYVTPDGLELSRMHKKYDEASTKSLLDRWIALYGYDAVEKHVQIMRDHIKDVAEYLANQK